MEGERKTFSDIVHPFLELPLTCSRIINTPQFERLRHIKLTGLTSFVYPSASHTLFEHSLGTSYLAGKYGEFLQMKQPELSITDVDVQCLYVAGLCAAIGHGPFTSTWERFMRGFAKDYSYEEMSVMMLDSTIAENNLGLDLSDEDVIFIKELILGRPLPGNNQFIGRKLEKHFLYEIVSNDKTKVDVKMFDCVMRDCKYMNIEMSLDFQTIMDNITVIGSTIVYRKKFRETLQDLLHVFCSTQRKAYQHHETKIIEEMIIDGLNEANGHFEVTGKNEEVYTLSNACKDASAFMKLTDSIFGLIVDWNFGGEKARDIFCKVTERKLYPLIGRFSSPVNDDTFTELLKAEQNVRIIRVKQSVECEVGFFDKTQPSVVTIDKLSAGELHYVMIVYACNWSGFENAREQVKKWAEKHAIELYYE